MTSGRTSTVASDAEPAAPGDPLNLSIWESLAEAAGHGGLLGGAAVVRAAAILDGELQARLEKVPNEGFRARIDRAVDRGLLSERKSLLRPRRERDDFCHAGFLPGGSEAFAAIVGFANAYRHVVRLPPAGALRLANGVQAHAPTKAHSRESYQWIAEWLQRFEECAQSPSGMIRAGAVVFAASILDVHLKKHISEETGRMTLAEKIASARVRGLVSVADEWAVQDHLRATRNPFAHHGAIPARPASEAAVQVFLRVAKQLAEPAPTEAEVAARLQAIRAAAEAARVAEFQRQKTLGRESLVLERDRQLREVRGPSATQFATVVVMAVLTGLGWTALLLVVSVVHFFFTFGSPVPAVLESIWIGGLVTVCAVTLVLFAIGGCASSWQRLQIRRQFQARLQGLGHEEGASSKGHGRSENASTGVLDGFAAPIALLLTILTVVVVTSSRGNRSDPPPPIHEQTSINHGSETNAVKSTPKAGLLPSPGEDRTEGFKRNNSCYREIQRGRLDVAEAKCQSAFSAAPLPWTRAATLFNLGLIAEKRGDVQGALNYMRSADDNRPHDPVIRNKISELVARTTEP